MLCWEAPNRLASTALWTTACQSVEAWRGWTGQLRPNSAARALSFALLAELGAATSFGALIVIASVGVLPKTTLELLGTWTGWLWFFGVTTSFATLMVALHLLWALCLEVLIAAGGRGSAALGRSLGFSLYICGWDLLTSPAGLLWAISSRGGCRGMALVASATTVPKLALAHYLVDVRGLPRVHAQRVALGSFVLPVAVAGVVTLGAIVWWWVL